jgi:hypothetical protein
MQICLECEQAFDGDKCWVCAARLEDIKETFSLSILVAGAGLVGSLIAAFIYPRLELNSLWIFLLPGMIFVPLATVLVLDHFARLARYALFVRIVFVLVAAVPVLYAAFFFLNGVLDGNAPVEAQALVSRKALNYGEGPRYILDVRLSWNQKPVEGSVGVTHQTFSAVEPGDTVHLLVHPGAFSTPWYDEDLLSKGNDAVRLNPR